MAKKNKPGSQKEKAASISLALHAFKGKAARAKSVCVLLAGAADVCFLSC